MSDTPAPSDHPRSMSLPSKPPETEPEPIKKRTFTLPGGQPITVVQAPATPAAPITIVEEEKPKLLIPASPSNGSPAISPRTVIPEADLIPPMALVPEKSKEEKKEMVETAKEEKKQQIEIAKEEKKAEIQAVKEEKMTAAVTEKQEKKVEAQAAKEEAKVDAGAESAKKMVEKEAAVEKKIIEKEAPEPKPTIVQSATMPVVTRPVEPTPVLVPVKTLPTSPTPAIVPVETVVPASTATKTGPMIVESAPAQTVVPVMVAPAKEMAPAVVMRSVEASPIIPAIVAPTTTPVVVAKETLPAPALIPLEQVKKEVVVERPVMVVEKPSSATVIPVVQAVEEKTYMKPLPALPVAEAMPQVVQTPIQHQTITNVERLSAGYLEPLPEKMAIFSRYTAQTSTTLRFSDKFHHQLINPDGHAVFHFLRRHHLVDDAGLQVACIHKSLWFGR